jgi:hypothetical protein
VSITDKASTPADPFADLFAAAVVEDVKNKKKPVRTWDGPIPDALVALVRKATADGSRVVLPVKDIKTHDDVLAMASAVVARETPEKVVYGTARHDEAKNITHVTFTVGAKRGRGAKKNADADAENAPQEDKPTENAPQEDKPAAEAPKAPGVPAQQGKTAGARSK